MYLYSYPSTHGISGLAAGSAWEQFEVRLKMTIEWTQRYNPRLWSSQFGDAIGDRDWMNSEIDSEAMIEWDYDWARLEEYLEVVDLEAVDGRRAKCRDSIHRLVNLKLWECDEVTLPWKLLSRTGWWWSIGREVRRKLKLHSGVNSKSGQWRDDRQS